MILRQRTLDDVDDFVAMDADSEVRQFVFGADFSLDHHRAKLPERIVRDFGPGLGHWTMRLKDAPHPFLGMVLLIPLEEKGPEIEIGWRLSKSAWGRGYASEAARAVLTYARSTLGLSSIVALIHPDNARSIAVATKLGMGRSGRRAAYGTEFDLYLTGENAP
ncbi:MAG: GNAT family N-acetyltransferase [Phreatobacter sp.]|uniref:GNAT family N-acetyltransferase n=1 Tax=Phreatobacter sp. TaxID=1966341 RepID=UPI0027365707|nr:GNAT family N-acetyltransferase [Phreatobacter sp.]MDP2803015.1 GNAT family N-acetyltransferase [Phreatobacter sp.]